MLSQLRVFAALVCLSLFAQTAALAQSAGDALPIVVLSVAPLDKVFTDIDQIGAAMGTPDPTKMAREHVSKSHGIDSTKPMGMWVSASKEKPEELDLGFFLTVTDPKLFEAALGNLGFRVSTEANGVKQYSSFLPIPNLPSTLHGKLVGSTFFLTTSDAAMTRLPRDPAAMLGDLPTKYLIGGKIQTRGVAPASLTALATKLTSMNQAPAGAPGIPGFDMSALQKASEASSKQLLQAIGDLNEVVGGVKFEPSTRSIRADWEGSYKPGSTMAKKFAAMKEMKSNLGGVVSLGNVYNSLNIDSITPAEQDVYKASSQMMRQLAEGALKQVGTAATPEIQTARQTFVDGFAALTDETTAAGIYDAGMAVRIDGKNLTAIAGMTFANGKKLEELLKNLATAEKSNPDFPEVLFNFATHQNVAIHFAKFPTPEDGNLKKAFGDEIDIAIGTGDKVGWIAVGAGALDTLKKAIDESALAAAKPIAKTAQMKISLAPALQFVGGLDTNLAPLKAVGESAAKFTGNAVIESQSSATDLGFKGDFVIAEDVFKLAREAITAAMDAAKLSAGS